MGVPFGVSARPLRPSNRPPAAAAVPFTKPRRENEFSPFMTHPFHHGNARRDISMARRRNFSWLGFGVLT